MEEQVQEQKSTKFKYKNDLINLLFVVLVFWAIFEPSLRTIVFWMILVLNGLVLIIGFFALKNEKLETAHYLNFLTKLVLIAAVLVGLFVPQIASSICALLFVLQLFQTGIGFYQTHLKVERRTQDRKPNHKS